MIYVNMLYVSLLLYTIIINNMKTKRESKRKLRHRFTWFDCVPTSTRECDYISLFNDLGYFGAAMFTPAAYAPFTPRNGFFIIIIIILKNKKKKKEKLLL
jgi:hypothetical protein